ncbi:MAG: cytochrome c [Pseudomonadota bacterium]
MRSLMALLCVLPASAFADHELDNRDIDAGATLYGEYCASCHGVDLEGEPNWRVPKDDGTLPAPPHDESGHTWHHDNRLLFDYTRLGGQAALTARGVTGFQSAMPGFGEEISDADIWDILAYIRSTWPDQVQDIQAGRNPPHD